MASQLIVTPNLAVLRALYHNFITINNAEKGFLNLKIQSRYDTLAIAQGFMPTLRSNPRPCPQKMPRFSVDSCTYYGSHFPLKFSHLVFYEIFTRENSPHPKSIFLETQQRVHLSLKFPTTNFIVQGKSG